MRAIAAAGPVLIFLTQAGLAFAGEAISVRAERSAHPADEQVSIVLKDDQVTLALNSNFLFEPGSEAELGELVAPLNEKLLADREELRRISSRQADSSQAAGVGPSVMRIYAGKNAFDPDSTFGKILAALMLRIRDEGSWKARRSAIVSLGSSDPKFQATARIGAKTVKIRCESSGPVSRCKVPGFGTAYLSPPAAH